MQKLILRALKLVMWLLIGVALLGAAYAAVVVIAYGDLTTDELEQRYPQPGLSFADINGVRIAYRDEGNSAGTPLLLLHSHYFTMRMWDGWIEALADDYRIIRFDLPTHGLTGPDPENDYGMARSQALIQRLLAHLQVEDLAVVGSSLGGNLAYTFAAENPDRTLAVALINSGGLRHKAAREGTIPGWMDQVIYLLPRTAYRRFLEWMIADDAVVTDALVDEFHDMFRHEGNRVAEMNRLRQFERDDAENLLGTIQAPSLVMWGKENPQLPSVLADRFVKALQRASAVELHVYPKVGHVIPLEAADRASRDLRNFLDTQL